MPSNEPAAGKGRYMISAVDDANAGALAEFVRSSGADPDIAVVDTIGPPGQPHTVVVDLSSDKALALARRFLASHQLLIEPDRPLSLFDQPRSP